MILGSHDGDCPELLVRYKSGLIAGILRPAYVQVEHLLLDGEDAMALVEVGIGEVLVVGEELVLEVSEADHVVATPVLVEELAATLVVDVLQRGLSGNLRCTGVCTDLVEEILGTCNSERWTCSLLGLPDSICMTPDGC